MDVVGLFSVEGKVALVTGPEGCDGLAAALREGEPALHLLVSNAGATWGAPLGTYPADGFDKVMDTNVRGPSLLTQAVLPALEQAATSQDPARVVMIGSVDGLAVLPVDGGSVTLR